MSRNNFKILPVASVVFPYQTIKLLIPPNSPYYTRPLIGNFLGICFQKDKQAKSGTQTNITDIGIAVKITHEAIDTGSMNESVKMISGVTLRRFKIKKFTASTPPMSAEVDLFYDEVPLDRENSLHNDGTVKKLKELAFRYVDIITESDVRAKARTDYIRSESNLVKLHYTIASYMKISSEDKYKLLELDDIEERMKKLVDLLQEQIKLIESKEDLKQKVRENIQREVRKQYHKRHMQEIDGANFHATEKDELQVLKERIIQAKLPEEVHAKAIQELNRLKQMGNRDPDYSVQKKYLDTIVELPWSVSSSEINDINQAEQILNRDHAGLEKVKKRILEFLAVKILKNDSKGSILCLQGPPGVGKTSLGKSIAQALGRKFERVSLGGVRDEAEIRGHRRTYVGAMPGVFIEALLKAKTNNPVILLDEIDKMGRNTHQGDPSSALLEVLDPNQNHSFKDHYLGLPFDLSNVLFIGTSNSLETIQGPLLDRMEVITLPGYTLQEKIDIAKNYLVPKQIKENGLKPAHMTFSEGILQYIISYYTKEAGVRTLERTIGSICRKVAFDYLKNRQLSKDKPFDNTSTPFLSITVDERLIELVLGPKIFELDISEEIDQPGVAIGMAWTQFGGMILLVETSRALGKGKLEVTGQLGDVMKESVATALGWIKAHQDLIIMLSMPSELRKAGIAPSSKYQFNLDAWDINVHFPAAAIPKDGPSAGITITTALVSLFTGIKVRNDIAMTGEISLKGSVLPVGGIREKCLAAHAAGMKNFTFVKHIIQVIRVALDIPADEIDDVISRTTLNLNKHSKL